MYSIQIRSVINRLTFLFYRIGLWQAGDGETGIKFFYIIYHLLFIVSLMTGAITNVRREKVIFLVEVAIAAAVVWVKLCLLITKQQEILDLLNRVCVFMIRDNESVTFVNGKLDAFSKFSNIFCVTAVVGGCFEAIVLPCLGSERTLFLEIGFPLDWKNSVIAYLLASVFLLTEYMLSIAVIFSSIIIWYLLLNCSLRYQVLGNDCKNMMLVTRKMSTRDLRNHFFVNLKAAIGAHLELRKCVTNV